MHKEINKNNEYNILQRMKDGNLNPLKDIWWAVFKTEKSKLNYKLDFLSKEICTCFCFKQGKERENYSSAIHRKQLCILIQILQTTK